MALTKPCFSRREDCRLCNSKDLQHVFSLKPTPPGDAYLPLQESLKINHLYPLDLFLCNNCSLLQLKDIVDPEILYGDYIYFTANSLGLVQHFEKYAQDIISKINPQGLIIDIGSNDGTLLQPFKKSGLKVLGVEPAKIVAQKAIQEGIPTEIAYFNPEVAEDIKTKHGTASVITANNVFANLDNLDEIIQGAKILLNPEGVFVFETGYMVDLIKNNIFDNIYHEHISYFSVKPLKIFFEKHEMELIDIQHLPTKGGSIRGIVQFKNASRKVSESVQNFINKESELKMHEKQTFIDFYKRIQKEGERIRNILENAKGRLNVGYGSSVGVTTMLYEWDLGNYLDFLLTDDESRHGLVSPGFKLPILNPKIIYEKNPENIIILAWRYSDPIISKHPEYKGRFITPFSESIITKTY